MDRQSLLAEMERLATAGDEKAFNAFVLEHFTKLPEEAQSTVLMQFATETLEVEAGRQAIEELRSDGLRALEVAQELKEGNESA